MGVTLSDRSGGSVNLSSGLAKHSARRKRSRSSSAKTLRF